MADLGGIFISYRRGDTAPATGRLADLLVDRFGASRVFMDVDTIGHGQDFVQRIERAVAGCDVLLAPIGARWLDVTDEHGRRRIDDPRDFVATEIATALRRGIPVIPVLVDGARMVGTADLPATLIGLATRNAARLDRDSFAADAAAILGSVQRIVETADLGRRSRPREKPGGPDGGPVDTVEEIAAVLQARSGRRTRRWWGTYLLAMVLGQMVGSTVGGSSAATGSTGSAVAVAGGLAWCVVALRREIAAQRLLVDQLPPMARIERIRRAVAPGRIRVVALVGVAVALWAGVGAVFADPSPASSPSPSPTTTTPSPTTTAPLVGSMRTEVADASRRRQP